MNNKRQNYKCIHPYWLKIDDNTWWKSLRTSICEMCNEKTIVYQDSKCYHCKNEINNKDPYGFVYGYYHQNNIYCYRCSKIIELDGNVAQKIIDQQYRLN